MKKEFLEAGKIVGTHGVRGMVRIDPWADSCEFLKQFKTLYIKGGNKALEIKSLSSHGRIAIAKIKDVETIEEAEKLRNETLYIKRDDAKLPEGRYFVDELIGCEVFDADTNECLGTITDVSKTGANDVWHIEKNGVEYLVPAIDSVIVSVDVQNEKAAIRPLRGIFDDED